MARLLPARHPLASVFDPGPEEPDDPYDDGEPDDEAVVDPFENVRDPTADLPDPAEVDGEIQGAFWSAVVSLNLALFATALGLMLVWFRGWYVRGGGVVLIGLAAFGYTWLKYRRFHADDGE
jgi:hypothetical protein